jgi:hypothetical protein
MQKNTPPKEKIKIVIPNGGFRRRDLLFPAPGEKAEA